MKSEKKPTLRSAKIRVGITVGDPAGIGPEITRKAIRRLKGLADFLVIGSRESFSAGKLTAASGKASIEYLDRAMVLLRQKAIDCLVTCPISKKAINLAGFHYSGHTEYFTARCGLKNSLMMLLNRDLKFSLVTRHIPLKEVPQNITEENLRFAIELTCRSLRDLFSIPKPRLVICGVNPHASDNGVIGEEENRIVKPLLAKLAGLGARIDGPLSADVAVAEAKKKKYDCVITMYHDQALIPLKLTDRKNGVNLTLGLPFIRTSPLHGTAFDIAGKNLADPSSLIAAIKLAVKCTRNQKKA